MTTPIKLIDSTICPHCRHRFEPHEVLSIAEHPDLFEDAVAGDRASRRFLASRFTPEGDAVDPLGAVCKKFACPRCHLEIPRAALELEPLFSSIVGAPGSGKSYFLATMTWRLRKQMPELGWTLMDADVASNERLRASEQKLFLNSHRERPVALAKTAETSRELYSDVTIDGASIRLPKPFQFLLKSRDSQALSRYVILYDNAGEHFLPNRGNSMQEPMTEHLAHSRANLFLLDPTQDPRLREVCESRDPQLISGPRGHGFSTESVGQEGVLAEMDARVRQARRMNATTSSSTPLIIVLSKADLLRRHFNDYLDHEPLRHSTSGRLCLDVDKVKATSRMCRDLLQNRMPEFVSTAEHIAKRVLYIPVSALGTSPEPMPETDPQVRVDQTTWGIRPDAINPSWVTVPFLCALQHLAPDDFPAISATDGVAS